jgi:NhaP-type Na+/H+ or K+/H+ antiporter
VFIGVFVASAAIGLAMGAVCSLGFRTQFFSEPQTPLESAVVVIVAYGAYMAADAAMLSGIVSVVFCAIVRPPAAAPGIWSILCHRWQCVCHAAQAA